MANDVEPLLAPLRHRAREPERLDGLDHVDALDAERLGAAQHRGAVVRIVQVLDHHPQPPEAARRGGVDARAPFVEQEGSERRAGGFRVHYSNTSADVTLTV